jgi:hypothetical protein
MLTDDDLTRELGAAFRTATENLTYSGRTRPPSRMTAALPAVGVAAVLAGVAVAGVNASGHHHAVAAAKPAAVGTPTVGISRSHHPAAGTKPRLVTRTMKLAGYTLSFQSADGAPDPVIAKIDFGGLPAGVQAITLTGTDAQGWIGTDPANGDNALYLKVPTDSGSRLFALESATWTHQQLINLFEAPEPSAVPAVSASSSAS